jgi:energy-coupling factor transporter ATP-binding protein EcfA2
MTLTDSQEAPISIVRIEVEKLFGKYTYALPGENCGLTKFSSLFVMYGDNGCGKTTVLKLLFHLLSPRGQRGHRSFIAKVSFKSFSIFLADGTSVSVRRNNNELFGSYEFLICKNNKLIAKTFYEYHEEDESVKGEDESVIHQIESLQLVLFFLGDDRVLDSDIFDDDERVSRRSGFENYVEYIAENGTVRRVRGRNTNLDFALRTSIQRTRDWVRQQALKGSNQGAANVHSIYEDIVDRIINLGDRASNDSDSLIKELIEELNTQGERSQAFSRFGLISPPLKNDKLIRMLSNVDSGKKSIVWDVLKPYLDSIAARLNALQETQDVLTTFVNTINEFLRDKQVKLNVKDGLNIFIDDEHILPPEKLSSGEKQLLLLLCNTLTARDKATIFIIDEPEISLNVKWQRNLIRALLDCTKGSQVQFLIATHSIELLSQYRSNVVKFEDLTSKG